MVEIPKVTEETKVTSVEKDIKDKDKLEAFTSVCVARRDYYWLYTPKPFLQYPINSKVKPTPLKDKDIKDHIEGTKTLGLSPFVDNENVLNGGIDFDVHKPTEKACKAQLEEFKGNEAKLKEWINELLESQRKCIKEDIPKVENYLKEKGIAFFRNSSGSEGQHIRIYPPAPMNAKVMRYFLINLLTECLGECVHEVFPKQDKLNEDLPFGNQMKGVLAKHPKTNKLAGIIENGVILDREKSLRFICEFAKKIPKGKEIKFDIPPELEKKHTKKKFVGDIKKQGEFNIPNKCSGFEEVACKQALPSGKCNRHDYLDGNAYQYFNNKPKLFREYCEIQGRDHTAFNNNEKWLFSCKTIHKYLNGNTGRGIDKWKECCRKCPLNNQEYMPDLKPLIEVKDDKEKRGGLIEDILKGKIEASPLEVKEVCEEISLITGLKETTLIKTWEHNKKNKEKLEIQTKQLERIDNIRKDTNDEFVATVMLNLAKKQRPEATELIVQEIKKTNTIYSTRDDERSEVYIYCKGIYVPQGKTYIREFCRKVLRGFYTTHIGNEVINKIEADTYVDTDKFLGTNYIDEIPVKNGVLNIITGELTPFTPKKIFFNKLPVTYDKTAKCPNIIKHFEDVLEHKSDVPLIQELIGYCLYKENLLEKAFMFLGDGRNGKSKSLELIKRFLGADNCTSICLEKLESDVYAVGELHNKMVNLAGDINKEALKKTSVFKTSVGRDQISAQRKFIHLLHFVSFAKHFFCANELPITPDKTRGFFSKWLLLNFPYTFVEEIEYNKKSDEEKKNFRIKDPNIMSKISNDKELNGLLNWSLEGLKRIIENKKFSWSQTTEEVTKMWIRKSDSFSAFLDEYVEEDYDSNIPKGILRKIYFNYCKKHKLKPVNQRIIKDDLAEKYGCYDSRVLLNNKQEFCWIGIKVKNE